MFSELTMCQDIDSFIVDVKQTAETLGHGHEGSISSADVRIELQMLRHVAPSSQQTDPRFWLQWFLVHTPLITLAIESFTVVLVRRIGCLRMLLVVSKRRRAGGMLVRNDEAHGCTHTRKSVKDVFFGDGDVVTASVLCSMLFVHHHPRLRPLWRRRYHGNRIDPHRRENALLEYTQSVFADLARWFGW